MLSAPENKEHGPDFSKPVYALWRAGMKYCVCSNSAESIRRRHPRSWKGSKHQVPPICLLEPADTKTKGRVWFGLDMNMNEQGVYGLFAATSREAIKALRAERKKLGANARDIIQVGEPRCFKPVETGH
jgi:hypothetical protein